MVSRLRLGMAAIIGASAILTTCELGSWQLRRAAGKEALQRQIDAAAVAMPEVLDATSLLQPVSLARRHLRLRGTWIPEHVVYLDNRPQAGRAGSYVLMALRIAQPVATEVIVNRGWIERDATDRLHIVSYRTPPGEIDVTGVVLEDEPRLLELAAPGPKALGAIWQNFDFDDYARASGQRPPHLVVRQDGGVAGDGDGLVRDWPDRGGVLQSQIDRHHAYAFQWFALAATLAALLLHRSIRLFRHGRLVPD